MFLSDEWKDYELLDAKNSEKLERWGNIILRRPDPQIVWDVKPEDSHPKWKSPDAHYHRSNTGGGHWESRGNVPESWTVSYKDLTFGIKMMGFKHTGLFPEQAVNWDWMINKIKEEKKKTNREIKVLNLFAYTGGATVACLSAGAKVTHVDASKGMVQSAKENARLSSLADAPIRYIVDDCRKFIEREIKREVDVW